MGIRIGIKKGKQKKTNNNLFGEIFFDLLNEDDYRTMNTVDPIQ